MEVLKVLESKNRCLKKFFNYSQDFLRLAKTGDFSTLLQLETHRDTILKAIRLYDKKITLLIEALLPEKQSPELLNSIKRIISSEASMLQDIMETDHQITLLIEEEKKRLLSELSASDKSAQLVKKFKSTWVSESGDKLDGKL